MTDTKKLAMLKEILDAEYKSFKAYAKLHEKTGEKEIANEYQQKAFEIDIIRICLGDDKCLQKLYDCYMKEEAHD